MKRIFIIAIGVALAAQISLAQAAQGSADQPQTETRFAPGTALQVELVKTIDAKKAKAGDPVVVKTSVELLAGTTVVSPRGTQIVGHVVAVTQHQKDTPSTLEIAFDKIQLEGGKEVPMKAVIQAVSEPTYSVPGDYGAGGNQGGGSSNPTSMGRVAGGGNYPPTNAPGGSAPNAGNQGNSGAGQGNTMPANKPLTTDSQGVIGQSNMTLGAGPQQDSLLTSQKHNVKLEGGTQMIIRTE